MATMSMASFARQMRNLDICMMTTQSARGQLSSRPMSNNGDVRYDGNSYFFSYEGSQKIKDIEANPQVSLGFEGKKELFISVAGKAKLIRAKTVLAKHWVDSLNQWFPEGLETPGIVLIHVKATAVRYWQKNKSGELKIK